MRYSGEHLDWVSYKYITTILVINFLIEFISIRVITILFTHSHLYTAYSLTLDLYRIDIRVILALRYIL